MNRIKNRNWILLPGFICLTLLLTLQSVNSPISKNYAYSDYSVYQYVARVMSEGGMPYRDTFDHKGPVFYLVNWLGYWIHPEYGMWILDFLLMFGTVVYAYKISNKVLNKKESFFVTTVVLSGVSAWGYWIGNTPETFILFFLMMTMYFFMQYAECQKLTNKQILSVGFSSALALLSKPTFLAMFFILVIRVLYETIKRKDFAFLKRCLWMFSVPFFGVTALVIVWLVINGAFAECINQYVIFNMKYQSASKKDILYTAYKFLERPTTLLGLFCVWINFMRWNEYTDKVKRLLIGTYAAWSLVFYVSVMPGRWFQQYTVMYYPMILIVVLFALKDIDKWFKEDGHKKIIAAIILIMLAVNVLLPNTKEIVANIRNYTKAVKTKTEVIDYFNNNPGEYEIAVVSPDDNWVYLQTGHASATKYSYAQADLIYEKVESDFIEEYSAAIHENHPEFIVESAISKLYSNKIYGNIRLKYVEVFRNNDYIVYELDGNQDVKGDTNG